MRDLSPLCEKIPLTKELDKDNFDILFSEERTYEVLSAKVIED
jgi:hypothetical protein